MGISKDIIIGSTGVIASEVVYITISKDKVGGEFNEKVTLTLGNKEINQIKIQIGDDNNYLIPNDLLNFKYEAIETEKESLTKNLVKVGLAAASAGSATSAIGSKDSFSKGATSALLGGAALKMGTTTKNKYVLLNLQFKDQKLLSLKMKSEEWDKFDEDHSVITFPEYEKEVQNQKDEINKQIEKIRASFMSLEASEQTEVTKDIQALSSQVPLLDETLEYRRKLVPKRITKEMTYDEESHLKQILTIKRIRKEKLTNEEEASILQT